MQWICSIHAYNIITYNNQPKNYHMTKHKKPFYPSMLKFLFTEKTTPSSSLNIAYKWIYWQVEYLAICLKNSVGVVLIWRNGR